MSHRSADSVLLEALNVLEAHERRAAAVLNLTASENTLSLIARLPLLGDVYSRYMFNETAQPPWSFSGARTAAWLETRLAVFTLRRLARATHVNVRPLSGLHAMTLVLAALGGEPGQPVGCLHPGNGGHYATADLARRLGLQPVLLSGPDPHQIDIDQVATAVGTHRPALVYLDQSHTLFPLDVAAIAEVVHQVSPTTRVYVDTSHLMGLVLAGVMPNPLEAGADGFGGSTHKTFPGPQKAFTATRDPHIAERIRATQPVLISSHHFAATASLGLAAAEFEYCAGQPYGEAILANTRTLAGHLADQGLAPQEARRGYSATHQLWVRTAPVGINAFTAGERLYRCGLHVNVLTDLPGITEPALRIGTAEATYRGLCSTDMAGVAALIADAVFTRQPAARIAETVAALMAARTSPYQWPLDGVQVRAALARLLDRLLDRTPPLPVAATTTR